jgi:hypothetical protein
MDNEDTIPCPPPDFLYNDGEFFVFEFEDFELEFEEENV